jgi:diguanylate cyclase (GGDEF)-like protein
MLNEEHIKELLTYLQDSDISKGEMLRLSALKKQVVGVLVDSPPPQQDHGWLQGILQLLEAISLVSRVMEVEEIALLVIWHMMKLTNADGCVYLQWKPSNDQFNPLAACGTLQETFDRPPASLDELICDHPLLNQIAQSPRYFQFYRDDPDLSPEGRACLDELDAGAILVLPVFSGGKLAGIIQSANATSTKEHSQLKIVLARLFANYTGIAISRAELYENAQQRLKELETLRSASITLTSSLDLHTVLDTLLEFTLEVIDKAQNTHIFLYENDELEFGAALWADGKRGTVFAHPRPDGLTYTTARRGELINIDDMQNHPLFETAPKSWQGSIIGLPLKFGDRVVGVMTLAHPETHAFSEDEIRILRLLGDQAAVAIENARLHNLVNRQAHTDRLTGLPNRRALEEQFEKELHRSQRYQHNFSLVVIDIDHFKAINDRYGHPTGDEFLKQLSNHMENSLRNMDFLVRYGGDEFTLLLPETDADAAQQIAARLQKTVRTFSFPLKEENLSVTITFGCATYPQDGETLQALMDSADERLYSDKKKR